MLELLFRNWPLKVLSLLLAFAIWVAVTGQNRIVQDFRVPLDITLPASLVAGEAPPTTLNLRLRGQACQLAGPVKRCPCRRQ